MTRSRLRRRRSGDDGYTLIELLTVSIIIGILAAVALSVFLVQKQKAYRSQADSTLRNVTMATQIMRGENEVYTDDLAMYEIELGQYDYFGPDVDIRRANEVGVWVDADRNVLTLATRAGDTCYYRLLSRQPALEVNGEAPIGAPTQPDAVPQCRAQDFFSGSVDYDVAPPPPSPSPSP